MAKGNYPGARVNFGDFDDRYKGPCTVLRMVGEDAASLNWPCSVLVHPVFPVSLLSPVEKEPPHHRRTPVVQGRVKGMTSGPRVL